MSFLRALLYFTALPALAVVLFGYFGSVHPSLDSLAHFRLHFAALGFLAGVLLMIVRRKAVGTVLAFAAAMPLIAHMDRLGGPSLGAVAGRVWNVLPESIAGEQKALGNDLTSQPRYRLLHANLRFDNPDQKEFLRLVGEVNPDVMTLNELSAVWFPVAITLRSSYPHQLLCTAPRKVGAVAILSKRPFLRHDMNGCTNDGVLALQSIDFGGRSVMVGTMHLYWPWPAPQSEQVSDLRETMRIAGQQGMPLIVAGDLNAAPWSHSAKRMALFLNAENVVIPWGSWIHRIVPQGYAWLGLPLDNVFVQGVNVLNAVRGRPFGSDHLPVLAEFEIVDVSKEETRTVLAN